MSTSKDKLLENLRKVRVDTNRRMVEHGDAYAGYRGIMDITDMFIYYLTFDEEAESKVVRPRGRPKKTA